MASMLQWLFSRKKSLIYTAFGSENYFRVVYKLQAAGVSFRTRTPTLHRQHTNGFPFLPRTDNIQYDIYVAKEDEYKAQMAIHGKPV